MPDHAAPLTVALLPLDERPVNTRYPQMLGAIAGATVLLPPPDISGFQRTPADTDAIGAWLAGTVADAAIFSTDYLLYGNLINARISPQSAAEVLPRLRALETLRAEGKPVYAFSLITRVSNADDAVEEPTYWAEYGTRFYRYAALLHRRDAYALEPGEADALQSLEAQIPAPLIADWLQRRLRNHTINLALLDLLARGGLDFLLITSDDTSPWGMPSREKVWLESWIAILGPDVAARTMMHPGADEVGSALLARLICQHNGMTPRIFPLYALPGGEEIVAPYEDRAVRLTVEGQIRAGGGVVATSPDEADIILAVLTPSPRRTEFRDDFAAAERAERKPHYDALFARLGAYQREGRPVAIGDVAYPNGADPLAIELLLDPACPLDPSGLAAYGAWNTAGNTLGVVVAQAICSLFTNGDADREAAQRIFLAHRFLEDWGYQAVVRRTAREANRAAWGYHDPAPDNPAQVDATRTAIEAGLRDALTRLQARGIGEGLTLRAGGVRLPWSRTFEVDFDLSGE